MSRGGARKKSRKPRQRETRAQAEALTRAGLWGFITQLDYMIGQRNLILQRLEQHLTPEERRRLAT